MIDYEVKIFNRVYSDVAPLCANNRFVSTAITEAPTAFPAACLIEIDSRTWYGGQSSTPQENYALVTYQFEAFATSKSKCRQVYAAADDAMLSMNFTRVSGAYMNNADNTKVFRYVARYEAVVDRDGNLYRRS